MVNQVDATSLMKLPTRLRQEPLVDAIFEVRVASDISLASVMPGVLFSHFKDKGGASLAKTSMSELSENIKKLNPEFGFAAQVWVDVPDFRILLGDHSLAVNCKLPYKGGKHFKAFVLEMVGLLSSLGIVKKIERYSLKYVDLVPPVDPKSLSSTFRVNLSIADSIVAAENASIRVEFPFSNNGIHAVNISSDAVISLVTDEVRKGSMIDIDSLVFCQTDDVNGFFSALPDHLNDLKQKNKEMFFSCLTLEAINSLGPEYV